MYKVAILFNEVDNACDPAAADVLTQCREIADSLTRLGHTHVLVPCNLNLATVRRTLTHHQPDLVFNLVESLGGTDRLMPAATLLLEAMQIPHTGASTQAIIQSGDKLQAKIAMAGNRIPTPAWFDPKTERWRPAGDRPWTFDDQMLIIKAIHEHASFEMGNEAVCTFQSDQQVQQLLADRFQQTGCQHLAEQFVEGREFNLSILEMQGTPHVLSPAEIDFSDLPCDLPRIVNASAKWDEDSVEYQRTPRRFDFPDRDTPLLSQLSAIARQCWDLFGLTGYGRVDFRVDPEGRPFVLEVNANPCLTRDAGFVAAAERAEIAYDDVIDAVIAASKMATSNENIT